MNSQTEDRLRAAFDAKAEQVTDERLNQLAARRQLLTEDDADWGPIGDAGVQISAGTDLGDEVTPLVPGRAPSRHARWFAPVLAAAAVLALAVGVTVISTTRHDGTPRPGNSTGPALLGSNQQADRSTIPWSQVGAGWTVALWTAATLTKDQDLIPVRPQSIFLVNPIGGRYLITTLNGNYRLEVTDWSTDARTALLIRWGDKSSEVIRLDLSTGKTQSFTAAGEVRFAKFTKPSGAAILLERKGAGIERVSLAGAHQLTYPKARTTQEFTPTNHLLSSPDGHTLVFAADHGLVVRAEDGTLRRTIAPPAGTSACSPVSWWDANSILAACQPELLGQEDAQPLFVVPILTPGSTAPLAPPTTAAAPGHPFTLAWRLGSGVLLLDQGGYCGGGVLGELDKTGHIAVRAIPTGLNGYGMNPIGSTTTTVTFLIHVLCQESPALVSFNPATNQLTRLLGPGLNGGSVLDAYGFGSPTYY